VETTFRPYLIIVVYSSLLASCISLVIFNETVQLTVRYFIILVLE